ncbi:Cellulose-binding family ii protein [Neofusicoccum parvum]|nr:Cellulose-binding family ii protein [Neofusicoccum parvum]
MENITVGATTGGVVPGWSYYGLERQANNTTIFVAPNGLNKGWANEDGEDVAFVDSMISTIETSLCINQSQRFATGFSYGGSMTRTLACARASVFRAVSVLSGALLSGCDTSTDPIPYLGIHGTNDPLLSISRGRELRDEFVKNNGCTPKDAPEPANGTLSHVKTVYEGCSAGYPVWWIAYDGGHISAPHDGPPRDTDSGDSFAPPETWKFFSEFFE